MRVPLSWLRNYVPFDLPANELAHQLTMAGNEVGDVEIVGADLDPERLVVGHVLSVDPHPNADRLCLPTVDIGNGETATVVCGAPNVAEGQKIAFAKEGAMLINPRSGKPAPLKPATIRGVRSSRGNAMLTKPSEITDDNTPRPRILTEEESKLMRENLAQKNFGMSFAEFAKAWNSGEFSYDRERHGKVLALAMLLPEYWEE